jgi:DNA-binding response OmpR family regulator
LENEGIGVPVSKKILIVDDDSLMRRSLAVSLEHAGYDTVSASSAEDATQVLQVAKPDLVLLDIGLPGVDGLEALRLIRQQNARLPIIFVTARRRELDEVVGLELGADDYITKPFDMDVLLAHVKAVLRRASPGPSIVVPSSPLVVGDISIDSAGRTVHVNDLPVDLSPKEFDLLVVLAQNAGRVVSLNELLERVWGANWIGESQTLYVHVRWLREKIEENPAQPRRLITVRGSGYKLIPVE